MAEAGVASASLIPKEKRPKFVGRDIATGLTKDGVASSCIEFPMIGDGEGLLLSARAKSAAV